MHLHCDLHDIRRYSRRDVAGHANVAKMQIPFRTINPQTRRADRVEMRTAGDENDVFAGGDQSRTEVAADAAGADDHDAHAVSSAAVRIRLSSSSAFSVISVFGLDAPAGGYVSTDAVHASSETAGSSPITAALCVTPRGTLTHSPGPSIATWPPMTRRNRPETTASILSTPCL